MTADAPSDTGLLVVESAVPARVLLVAFAGIRGRLGGVPAFEFSNLTASLPVHRAFVRDPSGLFFLRGAPGAGGSADELAAHLRAHRDRLGAERVVVVGNSSGGYAAILFAGLLDADEAHAIAPKTSLRFPEDFRDRTVQARLAREGLAEGEHADLRAFLLARPHRRGTIHVHYPERERVDVSQALRLEGVPGVRLHPYPWPDHHVVRPLRDTGVLARLVRDAVEGRADRHERTIRRARLRVRVAGWFRRRKAAGSAEPAE